MSLALYCLVPGVVRVIASGAPSYAWELFPCEKPLSAEALYRLRDQAPFAFPEMLFFGIYAGLFAVYAGMVHLMKGAQSATVRALVFGGGAVFLTAFLIAPVMLSTDVYAYGFYGRLLSVYGADAYGVDSSQVPADPFLALFGHATASVYGPFWTLISAGLTRIGGEHIGFTVLLFRGLAAGSVLLGAWLISSSLRRLAPERAMQGVVFFLWNPLVITEAGLSGHNDAALMVLVLLAIWLHLQGHRTGAVVALTLSALVKFVTGPLIPLYLWMALRESGSWKDRVLLTVRSLLAAGLATGLILALAHVEENAPTREYATAPDFYANNFHELIFKGLRLAFGEEPESVNVPIHFSGWWVKTTTALELRAAPDDGAPVRSRIKAGARLLIMAPPMEEWVRVYDPPSRQYGYVIAEQTQTTSYPPESEADPIAEQLENGPMEWPTVLKANAVIRLTTCLLFAGFGLFAAWRTSNFERFLIWAPSVMLALYFTVMTQIWPWYLLWALALGALRPGSLPFRLSAVLSAGMMTLYCTISFDQGDCPWICHFRSLPALVIPAAGFAIYYAWQKRRECRKAADSVTPPPANVLLADASIT